MRHMGGLASVPFDLQGAFLRMYRQEGLLDLKNENYVVFIFYPGRAQLLSCLHLGVSVHRGQTPAVQPGARLSPASMLLWFGLQALRWPQPPVCPLGWGCSLLVLFQSLKSPLLCVVSPASSCGCSGRQEDKWEIARLKTSPWAHPESGWEGIWLLIGGVTKPHYKEDRRHADLVEMCNNPPSGIRSPLAPRKLGSI